LRHPCRIRSKGQLDDLGKGKEGRKGEEGRDEGKKEGSQEERKEGKDGLKVVKGWKKGRETDGNRMRRETRFKPWGEMDGEGKD
jgi:hypothetical protein